MNNCKAELFQCVETGERPMVTIPVAGPENIIRGKAPKPDKQTAIAIHQTRGLSRSNKLC